jgi:hypothetical protein
VLLLQKEAYVISFYCVIIDKCFFNSCGAMTHDTKSWMERARKVGAKRTNKRIAPDEKFETFELDYDGKRDRWPEWL